MTSVSDDIAKYISGLTPLYDAVTEQKATIRQVFSGIEVRQRNVSSTPDTLSMCDTSYVDVIVKASGLGERGLDRAWDLAMDLYRQLQLILDLEIGQTYYVRISADSSPFEVGTTTSAQDRWVQFGLECVRFLKNVVWKTEE